jgi:hypothetical protein
VPCTVFLGNHTALNLRLGAAEAARVGMAFGAGGVVGALLSGSARHLFGAARAVPLLLAAYAATTFSVLIVRTPRLVEALAAASGALTPALFALMPADAGAGFATMSAASESDFLLFAIGGCFLLLGAAVASVPAHVVTTTRPTAEAPTRTSRPRHSAG